MNVANRYQGPEVRLHFLGGRHSFSSDREVSRIVRHRYVIGWYVLGVCATAFLHAILFPDGMASLELPISGISIFSFMAVVILYLRLWVRLSGKTDQVTVWMSPGLVLAAGAAHLVADSFHSVTFVHADYGLPSWAMVAAIYLLSEAVAALALRTLVPRVQRALRAGRDTLTEWGIAENLTAVTFGKLRILAADILRVEANGNSVQIVTKHQRHIVPGPFASVLAQLPQGAGCRVHRSHWVAAPAVQQIEQDESGLRLLTVQGDVVPVARPVSPEVSTWLAKVAGSDGGADEKAGAAQAPARAGRLNLASLLT